MSDCLFCKVASGQIPAKIVHQDADVVAFEDIHPQAPVHVLVVPRKHLPTLNDLQPADDGLVGKMLRTAALVAAQRGIAERGWRAVMNVNREGGQIVFHVHLHVLGARQMGWPPG
ncbi:MAG TPA: histidine triad nucleotide-binding protein [Anaeromyxobacteraceae bacterium]|nr:histidine triad nucleotide-binding protein [Anaeromyxobacteraceae bacterium]